MGDVRTLSDQNFDEWAAAYGVKIVKSCAFAARAKASETRDTMRNFMFNVAGDGDGGGMASKVLEGEEKLRSLER